MARTYGRPGKAAEFARMWAQISPQQQQAIVAQVQAAFREVKAVADGEAPEPQPEKAEPYKRHVRFEHGGLTIVNSARRQQHADAWAKLAAAARQIERRGR